VAYLISERGERFDQRFLATSEHKLVDVIIAALPDSVTPLRLAKIGVPGAVVGAAALVAVLASFVETCKRNEIDPQAYLTDLLSKIVARHPMSRIDELLPFAYIKNAPEQAMA
jgi:hypothetical protein